MAIFFRKSNQYLRKCLLHFYFFVNSPSSLKLLVLLLQLFQGTLLSIELLALLFQCRLLYQPVSLTPPFVELGREIQVDFFDRVRLRQAEEGAHVDEEDLEVWLE